MRPWLRGTAVIAVLTALFAGCSDSPVQLPTDTAEQTALATAAPVALTLHSAEAADAAVLNAGLVALTELESTFASLRSSKVIRGGFAENLEEDLEDVRDAISPRRHDDDDDDEDDDDEDDDDEDDDDGSAIDRATRALNAFVRRVDRREARGRLDAASAASLRVGAERVIAALTGAVTPESGGTVVLEGGAVTLDVPAGATTEPITITAEVIESPPSDPLVLGGTTYDFGPDGTQFEVPVAVTLDYNPSVVPDGLPADAVFIARLNEATGEWERVPGDFEIDVENGTVSGFLTSFSIYGVRSDECALRDFGIAIGGFIDASDCIFESGSRVQPEELYLVEPATLKAEAGASFAGAPRLDISSNELGYDGLLGLSRLSPDGPFSGQVIAFDVFSEPTPQTRSISVILDEAEPFQFFFGTQNTSTSGNFVVNTDVRPAADYSCGDRTVIGGDASFPGRIDENGSCVDEIAIGPNTGQIWTETRFFRTEAGRSYEIRLDGLEPGAPVGLLYSDRGGVDQELSLSSEPDDSDRSITFTASRSGGFGSRIEISSVVGGPTDYQFSIRELDNFNPCQFWNEVTLSEVAYISPFDCLFAAEAGPQPQDLYRLSPENLKAQAGVTFDGPPLLTFTSTGPFTGSWGFKESNPAFDQGLVYRFQSFVEGDGRQMRMIAPDAEYDMFYASENEATTGSYEFTTEVQPAGFFSCGSSIVIAGSVSFDSFFDGNNACVGETGFDENGPITDGSSIPLNYHPRFFRGVQGRTYRVTLEGGPELSLFALSGSFSNPAFSQLAIGESSAIPRVIEIAVPADLGFNPYYYVEASSIDLGFAGTYTLTVEDITP